ncbi:MAG: transglutaminase-like cysteine peptidase [Polymorphobacter sp.]
MRALLPFAAALLLAGSGHAAPTLDAARWAQLGAVNRAVNALPAASDRARFGTAEYWEAADASGGDCEDKALAARAALLAQGWPAESLRLALAWTEAHELHAVLTVEVLHDARPATYVLDSRFPWVLAWDALSRNGYTWLTRQAADGRWRKIANPESR